MTARKIHWWNRVAAWLYVWANEYLLELAYPVWEAEAEERQWEEVEEDGDDGGEADAAARDAYWEGRDHGYREAEDEFRF